MIANLFSRFDPASSIINLPFNWISTIIGLSLLPYLYWAMPSRRYFLWNSLTTSLHSEFKNLLGPNNHGRTIIFVSLFSLIIFNNLLGLIPYVFTRSRHLVITLSLALPLWLSFIIFGWIHHTQHIFAHLVPNGTPRALIPFIVIIETVRNVIRPGTLAVRLAANIIAGHLLLTLLGNTGPLSNLYVTALVLISQVALLTLEIAVAIIQSYVFAALRTLYARETK